MSLPMQEAIWMLLMTVKTSKPVGFMQSCCAVLFCRKKCSNNNNNNNFQEQDGFLLSDLPDLQLLLVKLIAKTQANTCLSCWILCSTTPSVTCMSSAHRLHMCTHHLHMHVVCMSSAALLMVSVDLNYLSTLTGTGYWMEFVARMLSCFISESCKWFVR